MKRRIIFMFAGICCAAFIAVLLRTLAYTTSMDLTKINSFFWEGSQSSTEPSQETTHNTDIPFADKNMCVIAVRKQFSSIEPIEAERFLFELKSTDSKAPLPGGQHGISYEFSINGVGTVSLPAIVFTSAGEYIYTIKEVNTAVPGYRYDTSVYTVAVYVEKQDNELKVTNVNIIMKKNGSEHKKISEIVFTNEYQLTDQSGKMPKMSDSAPIELCVTLLIISLAGFTSCYIYLILSRNKPRYGKK